MTKRERESNRRSSRRKTKQIKASESCYDQNIYNRKPNTFTNLTLIHTHSHTQASRF